MIGSGNSAERRQLKANAVFVFAFAAAALLSGCGDSDRRFSASDASVWSASADGPATREVIDGAQFMATSAVGRKLKAGSMSVSFDGANMNATGGCNSTYGAYTLREGRLTLGRAMRTAVDCFTPGEPGSSTEDQDAWLNGLLDHAEATVGDGGRTLVLSRGAARVTFGRQGPSDGPTPIADRLWTAEGFEGPMRKPTLQLIDGRASVFTGCNHLNGPAQVMGQRVVFGRLETTKGSCDSGYVRRVDTLVQRVLRGIVTYAFDGQTLTLSTDRGRTDLRFDLPYLTNSTSSQ